MRKSDLADGSRHAIRSSLTHELVGSKQSEQAACVMAGHLHRWLAADGDRGSSVAGMGQGVLARK
jgi:hypothetical protein